MKATFQIENPRSVTATLKLTMTVAQWMELQKQLNGEFPSWKLSQCINGMIEQAARDYQQEHEVDL